MANQSADFIRIGTTYFKKVKKPLISGDTVEILLTWSLDTIKQDNPDMKWKDIVANVKKYDGRCIIPQHINYQEEYNGFLNTYEPLPHQPARGSCTTILKFLQHVFGEQYDHGLDYLTIMYKYPTQLLPVLCLVSKERGTGKTTFINLLKRIFGRNMTFNTNEDFRSPFNSDWVSKLIIAVDEVLLDRKEDSEKIKNLATAKSYKSEAKGQDRVEVEFFGKFILCSNNEYTFMVIDPTETRYWVRKITPIFSVNPDLMVEMENEIPHFLNYINEREIKSPKKTRMWFTPEQIFTPALRKIKSQFVPKLESELLGIIQEIMENKELEEFCFINSDAQRLLERAGYKTSQADVRKILEENWMLTKYQNSSNYRTYRYDYAGFLLELDSKGRYYKIER